MPTKYVRKLPDGVKRSAKQAAHVATYKHREIAPPPAAVEASRSWWLDLPRAEFRAVAAHERDRMLNSKFGQIAQRPE